MGSRLGLGDLKVPLRADWFVVKLGAVLPRVLGHSRRATRAPAGAGGRLRERRNTRLNSRVARRTVGCITPAGARRCAQTSVHRTRLTGTVLTVG